MLACLGLQECKDQKPSVRSIESGDFEKEVSKIRRNLRSGLEDLIDEEQEEYTVEVKLDEYGNIPENFDYVGAIRDCVESTGKYRCFDKFWSGDTTCYKENPEEGQYPVSISNKSLNLEDWNSGKSFVRIDAGNAINVTNEPLDKRDVTTFQAELDTACKTTVDTLETSFSEDEINEQRRDDHWHEYINAEVSHYPELSKGSDELFALLSESGIKVEDRGGNVFEVDFGHGNVGTIFADFGDRTDITDEAPDYGVSYRVLSPDGFYTPNATIVGFYSQEFDNYDEAVDYALAIEEIVLSLN